MFIFLLYFLLNMEITFSTIIIQSAGVYEIEHDDIAMIFYLEVENSCDHDLAVSVNSLKCSEGHNTDLSNYMYLIGGDMGVVSSKQVKNLTLIYANLYLQNRIGTCTVALHYVSETGIMELRTDVHFNSNRRLKKSINLLSSESCNSIDLEGLEDCNPVDCTVKYSAMKSFFNRELKTCQRVTECPANAVYIPKSNTCRMLHTPVCESDLKMIEDGNFELLRAMSNLVNFKCHNGIMDNVTGGCICYENWITSTCSEGVYQPVLNIYHMCNIEINSWGSANRQKLIMTILVLLIVALAIVAKMLIAACLLNWCCHHFVRNRKKNEDLLSISTESSLCGDDNCSEVIRKKNKSTRTGVSFSQFEVVTSGEESSDIESRKSIVSGRESGNNQCHCCHK